MTNDLQQRMIARNAPWIVAGLMLSGAVLMGLVRGAPAVVLWLAFTMLSGAVLLFWEALRMVLDPNAVGDDMAFGDEEGVPAELEARKRAALRALRDIEFERAIQRLSDEDYKVLEKKYRAEARSAMVAIEQGLGPWLKKAEALIEAETAAAKSGAPAPVAASEGVEKVAEPETTAAIAVENPTERATDKAVEKAVEKALSARLCAKCEASNDADAVFCKRCGARIEGVADAN